MSKRRVEEQFLSSHRAARILQISKRTLHYWVQTGKIAKPQVNPTNGYLQWTMADIEAVRLQILETRT